MTDIHDILGQQIRVVISDGRIIEGELSCIDKDLNLILASSLEYHGIKEENAELNFQLSNPFSRSIGLAMIPGNHIVKVIVQSKS
mmetsp:Transcript_21052/g.28942  ORF Transcript_21052/g.28942 Transcript_21052/m.28942 type:complete len:85 (-) Transcript_21052:1430-1684(-)